MLEELICAVRAAEQAGLTRPVQPCSWEDVL